MTITTTRRQILFGTIGGVLGSACAPRSVHVARSGAADDVERALATIEQSVGGRIGIFAIDTGTGRRIGHREDERFAMCSTFKWILAAAVLLRIDHGELSLDERVPYGPTDLLDYAPFARAHVAKGSLRVGELARAAVVVSDNTAANLLLSKIGGPAGVTRFVRQNGDEVIRLDRMEPALNENAPGDPRDTTSPRAMAELMTRILCKDVLTPDSRERLLEWLRACETGNERLRAGLPASWMVGDKTGTGPRGACNDVAIAVPPGRAPVILTVYTSDGSIELARLNAAHVEAARAIARTFVG